MALPKINLLFLFIAIGAVCLFTVGLPVIYGIVFMAILTFENAMHPPVWRDAAKDERLVASAPQQFPADNSRHAEITGLIRLGLLEFGDDEPKKVVLDLNGDRRMDKITLGEEFELKLAGTIGSYRDYFMRGFDESNETTGIADVDGDGLLDFWRAELNTDAPGNPRSGSSILYGSTKPGRLRTQRIKLDRSMQGAIHSDVDGDGIMDFVYVEEAHEKWPDEGTPEQLEQIKLGWIKLSRQLATAN